MMKMVNERSSHRHRKRSRHRPRKQGNSATDSISYETTVDLRNRTILIGISCLAAVAAAWPALEVLRSLLGSHHLDSVQQSRAFNTLISAGASIAAIAFAFGAHRFGAKLAGWLMTGWCVAMVAIVFFGAPYCKYR